MVLRSYYLRSRKSRLFKRIWTIFTILVLIVHVQGAPIIGNFQLVRDLASFVTNSGGVGRNLAKMAGIGKVLEEIKNFRSNPKVLENMGQVNKLGDHPATAAQLKAPTVTSAVQPEFTGPDFKLSTLPERKGTNPHLNSESSTKNLPKEKQLAENLEKGPDPPGSPKNTPPEIEATPPGSPKNKPPSKEEPLKNENFEPPEFPRLSNVKSMKSFFEWVRQRKAFTAVYFISKYGKGNYKAWAESSRVTEIVAEEKARETALGYFLTKYLKMQPNWRLEVVENKRYLPRMFAKIGSAINKYKASRAVAKPIKAAGKAVLSVIIFPIHFVIKLRNILFAHMASGFVKFLRAKGVDVAGHNIPANSGRIKRINGVQRVFKKLKEVFKKSSKVTPK
ncbi:hypothetical protein BY996DRAFT_6635902 [Phakopsora pachyrhizi]|uniref:Expressed protein n=1 Tax=Phakopsora pachyrhizi TaxID=170000 RepID=A0AAV0AIN7_PHAPC|nr:hypothetical protein BY996DRAFT_6635902 [Phakopsora pachyrhizi]CAH7667659.1 expressed protein [Phakopsora pachyrhizi]